MSDGKPSPTTPPGERIAKRLSRAGVASRRAAEAMIAEGRIAVNGRIIASPALNVLPTDRITVDGQPLPEAEPVRLWRYHKPTGLITTASDERGRTTVFESLPPDLPRVMSVGRLDINSEGLLLLTNDGELKNRLESPATGWTRRYRVRAMGNPTDADLEPLRKGITVEGERFRPMTVSLDRQQGANVWLTLGLKEGKYREVRRALDAIGLTVNRLIRLSYGPFQLGDLAPGAVEEVKGKVLRDQLGLETTDADAPKSARPDKGPRRPAAKQPAGAGPSGRRPPNSRSNAKGTAGDHAGAGRPAADRPDAKRPRPDRPSPKSPRR